MSTIDKPRATPLLNPWAWAGVCFTLIPLMLWSSVSITVLTHAMGVNWDIAWIPAAATDGAMMVATGWAVNHLLDKTIRNWSACVAVTGIVGSVIVAAIEHYVTAAHIQPPAELAALIGGIPSLMGALIVHVIAMIRNQQKRDQEDLESAVTDWSKARSVRAAIKGELAETDRERREGFAEQLQKKREDATRLHQEGVKVDTEAATRAQQGLQQERDKVTKLRGILAEEQFAADAEAEVVAETRQQVEADRDAAAQALDEARTNRAEAAEEDKEAERLRNRARRKRQRLEEETVSQPVSRPSSQGDATVSQLSSQAASRQQRVEWALSQLRAGRDLRPRDIDAEFSDGPRTGAAVLAKAKELFERGDNAENGDPAREIG